MPKPKIKEKNWDKSFENDIYNFWKKNNLYKFDKKSKKPIYSIDTPPPYINSPVHIGQVTTYCLMDFFARYRRMKGYNVLFPLGLDKNGLPIEMAVEKQFNIKLTEMKRDEFLGLCKKLLQESSLASVESFLRCGISFNSWKIGNGIGEIYETDSNDYRTLTQETFIDLWKKGLVYEDERINNWCPGCQTTLADAEIVYQDINSNFNDVKFKVKETGEEIIIGTTRPELICTCGMIIFNPEDERYKHLQNKTAVTPIFNKEVPIKAHPLAEIEKGTGLVMMCSAGDLSDIQFFREMKIKPVIAINKDGTMNEQAGFLRGLKVREARAKIIDELNRRKLLVSQKLTIHRTPTCERSGDEIEFISMKEYYLKQLEFKNKMKELAYKIKFYHNSSRQILLDWIDSVSIDWPISRRRYYATEIPLWYCKKCNEVIVPPKGKYYQPWKEKPPIKKCKCGSTDFIGEERVFDTWFDSSITPLYILKYSRDDSFFKKAFPCTLRPSGKEIIRNWGYYTILRCFQLTNKCIFKDYWVNYHIIDEKGYKMSKSKGNVIDPKEVLDRFGAEPFRLWAAIEGNLDRTDFKCSFDRIEGASKTLNKIWNVAKFISIFDLEKGKLKYSELDLWIINEINNLIKLADEQYMAYDFNSPIVNIKHFIWETLASHYIEMVKSRAYNDSNQFTKEEQAAAISTLYFCLESILKLLAPVLPVLTYKIYYDLNKKDIHFESFPKSSKKNKVMFNTQNIFELNNFVWKAKKDKGLSLKAPVKILTMPNQFKKIEKEIRITHNIGEIKFGKKFEVEF